MQKISNTLIDGSHGRPIPIDIYYRPDGIRKPLVIFAHGFKGFKDWGLFPLIAETFAENGFVFAKFNFSHNGTTADSWLDFGDLEAFGQNNFTIEMDDLGAVIDFLLGDKSPLPATEVNQERLSLIGHSRGGGICIIKAAEDRRISKLVTWASVNNLGRNWHEAVVQDWQKNGVLEIPNSRTKQIMPLYWQLYEDFNTNADRFNIAGAVKSLSIPFLIIHGTADSTVNYQEAMEMSLWNTRGQLLPIEDGDHTFGGKHPWTENNLPSDSKKVVEASIKFLR